MIDLGRVRPGEAIFFPFSSFDSAGASATLSGLAVTDIEVYKSGGMVQRASDSGYALLDTDGIDLDGITGINGFYIDLADNTDAGFWGAGSTYFVVVSSITIDGQTVNYLAGQFYIGYDASVHDTTIATLSSQTSFTLVTGSAEDDAYNGMWVWIHDVASYVQGGKALVLDYTGSTKTVILVAGTTFTVAATDNISFMGMAPVQPTVLGRTLDISTGGEAGVDWANVGSPTTALNLSATNIDVDQVVASVSGAVGSVTGAVGSVTGNVGGSVATAINLTNAPTNGDLTAAMKTAVQVATAAALAAFGFKVKKNTALANFPFLMVLSSDHVTPATGLTVVVQRSIDGAAFANSTNTPATEVANGVYKISLSAADLNGDTIVLKMTSATADQRTIVIATQA